MNNERKPQVVLDFDGTISDSKEEAATYVGVYRKELARRLGMTEYDLATHLEQAQTEIRRQPQKYGWENKGFIVAPATASPAIFLRVAAQMVIANRRAEQPKHPDIPSLEKTSSFLQEIFYYAYPSMGTAFRDGAKNFVLELNRHLGCVIVTNSNTTEVEKKLTLLLGNDHGIETIGQAKKYEIDPAWSEVPEQVGIAGFPRPVWLRRKEYGAILKNIGPQVVVGDIYELDLALPEHFKTLTVLALTEITPQWEFDHYTNHANGFASENLGDIAQHLLNQ